MTKYAIVGLGYWGINHLRALVKLRNQNFVDEIIVCDPSENALKKSEEALRKRRNHKRGI